MATLLLWLIDRALVRRRVGVPEKWLLGLSLVGGALGAKLAQIVSGHKRARRDFTLNLHLIVFLHLGLASAVWAAQFTGAMEDGEGGVMAWMSKGDDTETTLPRRFGPGGG